ncbi:MAG: penicillin-binding protein activator LpoB [Nitrospirae bacterium]|nr:penicillin-binding protein activator LpoB [Candidatus Troglogloeales bacterium]
MQKKIGFGMLFVCGMVLTSGCATTSVARLETEQTVDLSDRWNDTDSRKTAAEMVKEALGRPWVDNFQRKNNKEPMVIVGAVLNKSHDHIPTETFTKDLERELTNSGRVTFVASKDEREEVRQERLEQQTNSSEETAKGLGKEIAADYMLKGVINSFEEEAGKEKYKYFQVTLEMIDMEKNTKVWFGDKKIKKLMTRKKFGF